MLLSRLSSVLLSDSATVTSPCGSVASLTVKVLVDVPSVTVSVVPERVNAGSSSSVTVTVKVSSSTSA